MDPSRKLKLGLKDYYSILGLSPDCEHEEIKVAYRNAVKIHHPDHNPDDNAAAERFLEVKEAYELLSDPELRAEYDQEFVEVFPGFELEIEEDEEEWEENPPATMPILQEDGSDSIFRMLIVLILPLLVGGLAMHFTSEVIWTFLGVIAGLTAAIWIAAVMKEH